MRQHSIVMSSKIYVFRNHLLWNVTYLAFIVLLPFSDDEFVNSITWENNRVRIDSDLSSIHIDLRIFVISRDRVKDRGNEVYIYDKNKSWRFKTVRSDMFDRDVFPYSIFGKSWSVRIRRVGYCTLRINHNHMLIYPYGYNIGRIIKHMKIIESLREGGMTCSGRTWFSRVI